MENISSLHWIYSSLRFIEVDHQFLWKMYDDMIIDVPYRLSGTVFWNQNNKPIIPAD